jgi:CHAT domain-containing protein/Tfp pilus assembly protein PilF
MSDRFAFFFISIFLFFMFSFKLSAQTKATAVPDSLFKNAIQLAKKGKYRQAFSDFDEAINLYSEEGEDSPDVAKTYIYIGHIERRRGNHDAALSSYEKGRAILFKDENRDVEEVINLYMGMGSAYRYLQDFSRSLDYTFEALRLCEEKHGSDYFRVGFLYNNIANIYDDQKDYESALEYYGLSKDILEKSFADAPKRLSNVYTNYGEALTKSEHYDEAQVYYERAIQLQGQSDDNRSPHLILGLIHLGELLMLKNSPEEAVPYYERAIELSGLEQLDKKYFSNINSPEDCIAAMAGLGKVSNLLYELTSKEEHLIRARKVLDLANEYIEYLKADFKEVGARGVLMRNSYPVYEQAIAMALNTRQKRKENFKEAFAFSEKSRNNLLREAVQDAAAKKFAGIPDSLLAEENSIKIALLEVEKRRFDAVNKKAKRSVINDLEEQILGFKNKYADLIATFESEYPDYYDLKYAVSTVSVDEIRDNILQPNQAMLEYFVGDDMIFAFVITKDLFQVFNIDKNFALEDSVRAMRKSIFEWRPRADDADEKLKTYQRTSFFLYDRLLRPFEHVLPEKLIIIPGGVLGYLPFEALLEESPQSGDGFAQYSYLIRNKQISYSYSATLLKEMLKNTNTGREVLGFAPSFGEYHRDSLPENLPYLKGLNNNEKEVEAIQKLLGGRVFTGEDATLQTFLEIAPLYKILHLATHGKANDKADEYSYLAFSYIIDDLDNELLYAGSLYNTELRADMVVLSACETGIGDFQQGEGILSLARGFSYAGAKSIVTTLWSIDDKSSLEIMVNFYGNLEDGKRKDYALREAKLDFINNNNRRAHPIYWAAYIPIGNMEAIAIGRESNLYLYLIAFSFLGIFLFLLFGYLKKQKRKNKS